MAGEARQGLPGTTMLLAAMVLAFMSNSAAAQQGRPLPTGSVGVRVGGERVDGTTVTVKQLGGAERSQTKVTGANGKADFSDLPEGNYEITVVSDGKRGTSYVRVSAERPTSVPFSNAGLPTEASFASSPDALLDAVKHAATACDRQAYDAAVTELERDASLVDTNVRDLNNMVEEYGRLSGYQPNLGNLRAARDSIMRQTFGGRRGVTGDAQRAGAPVDMGLLHLLGYIDALERLEKARERQRAFEAALRQVPPFSQNCGQQVGLRLGLQLALAGDVGIVLLQRPQFRLFRTELNGVIEKLGAFRPDNADSAPRFGGTIGTSFDAPFLGEGKKMGVKLRGWYKDAKIDDSAGQIDPPAGGTVGLFSPSTQTEPFGGYFTHSPLTDIRYRGDFQSYGGELQFQTWLTGGGMKFAPYVGARLGQNTVDEHVSSGIGSPAFATFVQKNAITDTFVGPTAGLEARYDFRRGFFAFSSLSAGVDYHSADGNWRTFVPAVDTEPRRANLSSKKVGFNVGGELGAGVEFGGLSLEAAAGAYYYSAAPYLKFKDADSTTTGTGGADIGFGGQTEYLFHVRGRVSF